MRLDATPVRSATQGRWTSVIFPALGIEVPPNPRKHGPCPFCGGKDRFRCDDRDGFGSWFCNQCTPKAGDGFALIMKVTGCTFPEALQRVASVLGLDSTTHRNTKRTLLPPPARPDRRALAFRFELAALHLRLRAERIAQAGSHVHIGTMTDEDLDRALALVARGHADVDRAGLFEHVADTLRARDFEERMSGEQRQRVA